MAGIRDDEIAALKLAFNDFLPESGTIVRTGLVVDCRLSSERARSVTAADTPGPMQLAHLVPWTIFVRDEVDLRVGDTISITDEPASTYLGTFWVSGMPNPRSYSIGRIASAVRLDEEHIGMAAVSNARATFTNPANPSQPITAPVFIYDAAADAQIVPEAARYRMAAMWDAELAYPDGKLISGSHQITWTQPNGIQRTETLSKPRYQYALWGAAIGYFDVIN